MQVLPDAGSAGSRIVTNTTIGTEVGGATSPVGPWFWRAARSARTTAGLDVVAIAAGFVALGGIGPIELILLWIPVQLLITGDYRHRINVKLSQHVLPILAALAVPVLALGIFDSSHTDSLLRKLPELMLFLLAGRVVSLALVGLARRRWLAAEPTLIVGAGTLGCQIATTLLSHPEYGIQPIGFVDDFPDDDNLPLPLLSNTAGFDRAIRQSGARRVIVAYGANREPELVEMLRASVETDVDIHVVPRFFELGVKSTGPDAHLIWGLPLHDTHRADLRSPAWRVKRIFDVVVASMALVVLSPVIAGSALAVRLSSHGPILFRQRRVGQRGQTIDIYKFRSMRINSDSDIRWGGRSDDRITPAGRLLRATSIDELPQLFNVIRGDMSLVGPRPERPHFSDQFEQKVYHYKDRLRVPVGLTGWAQVHGLRGDTSIEERARFDNYYIEHWSLWLDLVILARTFWQVVREVAGTHTAQPSTPAAERAPAPGSAAA
jgi:exopolysaccharide biosynthesis polyprenyl glycosylphosphotransferase